MKHGEDRLDDAIQIAQHVIVPKSDHAITARIQPGRSRVVLLAIGIVLPTIEIVKETTTPPMPALPAI